MRQMSIDVRTISNGKPAKEFAVAVAAEELIKLTFSYTADIPRGMHSWLRNPMYNALIRLHQEIHLANETFVDYPAIKRTLALLARWEQQKGAGDPEQLFFRQTIWHEQLRSFQRRLEHITQAIVQLKTVCMYMRVLFEKRVVSTAQYEKWSATATDVQMMLGAWKASERKRVAPNQAAAR
ncbi:MAG: hypothetical protein ACOYU7_03945 [Bacillota bacterium]